MPHTVSPALSSSFTSQNGTELALLDELQNSADVLDEQNGTAMINSQQQSQSLNALTADSEHSLVSSVTKISPSPDWFTGFADLSILDNSTNTWFASVEVETFPWDAGTDSGTDPQGNITRIQGETGEGLPKPGVFVSSDNTTVLSVAKWTCSVSEITSTPPTASPSSVSPRQVSSQGYTVVNAVAGTIPSTQNVELSCEFTNQWTAERHPLAYPTANAHWSPMILASHSSDYTMWADGQLASPSMQIVAEVRLVILQLHSTESIGC